MPSPRYMLGIESSCDETACALVDERGYVFANNVASQIDLHARFGGVVPEVASRRHLEVCLPMVDSTLRDAGVSWDEVAGIAVTQGPGLIGCLLIGVETAKALAWRYEKPLHAVHHLAAHLYAPHLHPGAAAAHLLLERGESGRAVPFLTGSEGEEPARALAPEFPLVGLIVSGGHTSLVYSPAAGLCETLASTRDDAVGEAYDKVARLLGLGYPGGPIVDRLAAEGNARNEYFTPPMMRRDEEDFSFSGLKSAVSRRVKELQSQADGSDLSAKVVSDLCAGFQATVLDVLLEKSLRAARARGVQDLLIVGGVAANRGLRAEAARRAPRGLRVWFPNFSLCTDNAGMIAGLGWKVPALSPAQALQLNPEASLPFPLG